MRIVKELCLALITINNFRYPEYSSLKIETSGKSYNLKEIKYFKKQKWSEKHWIAVNGIIESKRKIVDKCNLTLSANLTNDAFYFILIDNKIQLVPFSLQHNFSLLKNHFYNIDQNE